MVLILNNFEVLNWNSNAGLTKKRCVQFISLWK